MVFQKCKILGLCSVLVLGGMFALTYAGVQQSRSSYKKQSKKFKKHTTVHTKKKLKKTVKKKNRFQVQSPVAVPVPPAVQKILAKKSKKVSKKAKIGAKGKKNQSKKSSITRVDRVEGSLIGGALGDAMGNPTEFIGSVPEIYTRWPNGITSFESFKTTGIVPYTDDTAMTKVTMEVLNQSKKNNWDFSTTMSQLASAYVQDMQDPQGWAKGSRAPGNGCVANVEALAKMLAKDQQPWVSEPLWWQAGEREYQREVSPANPRPRVSGGCGSVMRAHPFGLVFADNPAQAVEWAAQHSKITHGHPIALAASAALAAGIAQALRGASSTKILQHMITAAALYDGQTADMIRDAIRLADENRNKMAQSTLQEQVLYVHTPVFSKYLGWLAHDAIAATAYIFALYPDDIKKAIYLGVHTPGDSDSIASMAGALVGAYVGFKKVQQAFRADIPRLENMHKLIALAQGESVQPVHSSEKSMYQKGLQDQAYAQQQAHSQYVPGTVHTQKEYQVVGAHHGYVAIKLILDGQITQQYDIDAIVNAANESLIGSAGIAKDIQDAAGDKTFKKYITTHMPRGINGYRCQVGQAVYTPAFALEKTMHNKFIIHTVGPHASTPHAARLLGDCYVNSYKLANQLNVKSIAIGTISTGIFGFPKPEAAGIVTSATVAFAKSSENRSLREIRLLVWGQDYFDTYTKLLDAYVGDKGA